MAAEHVVGTILMHPCNTHNKVVVSPSHVQHRYYIHITSRSFHLQFIRCLVVVIDLAVVSSCLLIEDSCLSDHLTVCLLSLILVPLFLSLNPLIVALQYVSFAVGVVAVVFCGC